MKTTRFLQFRPEWVVAFLPCRFRSGGKKKTLEIRLNITYLCWNQECATKRLATSLARWSRVRPRPRGGLGTALASRPETVGWHRTELDSTTIGLSLRTVSARFFPPPPAVTPSKNKNTHVFVLGRGGNTQHWCRTVFFQYSTRTKKEKVYRIYGGHIYTSPSQTWLRTH